MQVTLHCDLRVKDVATGAAFLNTFKDLMEGPNLLPGMAANLGLGASISHSEDHRP